MNEVTKSPSDEDEVKIDDYSGHPVRGQEPECDPYWCPCPVCQKRMNAQRLTELSDKAPTAWVWNYDSLADEVHVSFSLDGVRHKIEHDVARCDCDTRRKQMISPVTGKEPTKRQMNITTAIYVGLLLAAVVFVSYLGRVSWE